MDQHIARNGQQIGIFSEAEVQAGLSTGRFQASDLYWSEGMTDWQPLGVATSTSGLSVSTSVPSAEFNPYAPPQSNIVSSAMMPQLRLASRGVRFGAAMIDTLIILFVMLVPLILGIYLIEGGERLQADVVPVGAIVCFCLSGVGMLGLLVWNAVLLGKHGQTIAKRWLKIRIVSFPSGQPAGFGKAFGLRAVVNTIISQIVPLYGIVDVCFIFREDKRCLHDLIAETTVVED